MILDNSLLFADNQTTTTSVASTDYADTLAAGDANVGAWFVVRVHTAFNAGAGAPQIQFQLQTSPASNFTDAGTATLLQSSTFLVAALTANDIVYKARIPSGAKRYLRGYKNISNYNANTAFVSACGYDMFIVKDADINEIPGAGA